MGWHQSKSDPCKVYDGTHTDAARAMTPEIAAMIVEAINKMTMRAPSKPLNMWAAEAEPCCAARLLAASRSGLLDSVTVFICARCGCEWDCTEENNARAWRPSVAVMVLQGRR